MKMLLQAIAFVVLLIAVILSFVSFGIVHPAPWVLLAILIAIPVISNKLEASRYASWKPEYSIGIQEIDDQHKSLMNLINKLQLAIRYHQGEYFERQALEELAEYTKTHFKHEEEMMLKYGYPDYQAHKREHDEMAAKVQKHIENFEQNGHSALLNMAPFVWDWLTDHIYGVDQSYAKFLRENGYLEGSTLKELDNKPG